MRCSELVWFPASGVGFYPVKADPYDRAYYEKYAGYARTPLGAELTRLRVLLVERHAPGAQCLDVGPGACQFVDARPNTWGYDVNPASVKALGRRFRHPLKARSWAALTFWDSLEHLRDPDAVLGWARDWVFVSLPIFTSGEQVLRSKHFRPDEHRWYWTRQGLIGWMAGRGFRCREHNTAESLAGREDIESFAFRRVA